jgi:hypothetical protein
MMKLFANGGEIQADDGEDGADRQNADRRDLQTRLDESAPEKRSAT